MDCSDTSCGGGLGLPTAYNIKSRLAGDTWPGFDLSVTVNGDPVDFTGASVKIAFKESLAKANPTYTLTTVDGDITLSGNIITVLPMLLRFSPKTYYYDLQVTFADNSVRTYLTGRFDVLRDITQ